MNGNCGENSADIVSLQKDVIWASRGSFTAVNSSGGQGLFATPACKPGGGTTSNKFVSLIFLLGFSNSLLRILAFIDDTLRCLISPGI